MVDATIDVIYRGGLECDQNYMIEGQTLGTHDEPNRDIDYEEIPVWNLVIDHPEATILWDTGSHHEALGGQWPAGLSQVFCPHDGDGTVVFTDDQVYQAPNYEEEAPLGAGLLWGKTEWFDSIQRIKDPERRHDAEIVYGHDTEQFPEIEDGWGH